MGDYHRFYNEQVVAKGEPYNTEALSYLDAKFKGAVTAAMEACLDSEPEDPIRFLADTLKAADRKQRSEHAHGSLSTQRPSAAGSVARSEPTDQNRSADDSLMTTSQELGTEFTLAFAGGVTCCVRSAAAVGRASCSTPAPVSELLPGLPLYQLVAPTTYELETVVRHLEASAPVERSGAPSRTVLIVEPPTAPTELFFLQGIPYYSNLAETLAQHQRRGNRHAPQPQPGQTHSQLAVELLGQSLSARVSNLSTALEGCAVKDIRTVNPRRPSEDERVAVVLPYVQANYLHVFDSIDAAVDLAMTGSPCAPLATMPTVVFVTYNTDAEASSLTLARLLAAYVPHVEAQQRHGVAAMRATSEATLKELSYEYNLRYWDAVHDRRETRDEARGIRRAGARRVPRAQSQVNGASADAVTSGAPSTPASPKSRNLSPSKRDAKPQDPATEAKRKEAAQARELRRQQEDSAFLAVLHDVRDRAATTIQTLYRGWRVRKELPGVARDTAKIAATAATLGCDWTKPADVPPMLWFALQELHRVHGDLFGNYTESPLPEPRVVRVHRPRRRRLPPACDGDPGSEADEWEQEEVLLPPKRLCRPVPHVNPLRRLLECHGLAHCHRLSRAVEVQRQCSGMSLLLRRSYDQIKSLVLDLAHIAYVELVHRRRLAYAVDDSVAGIGAEGDSFSSYMQKHMPTLLGALAYPHLLSRSVLGATEPMRTEADRTCLRDSHGIVDADVLNTEQLVVLAAGGDGGGARLGAGFRCVAPCVYTTAPFLSDQLWMREVGAIREHAAAAQPPLVASAAAQTPSPTHNDDQQCLSSVGSDSIDTSPGPTVVTAMTMDWWSLSPLPVTYVAGTPLALVPRSNRQDVQGLSAHEHFVPSVVVKELEGVESLVGAAGAAQGEAADGGENGAATEADAPTSQTARRDERYAHFEQVVDGVLARRLSSRPSPTVPGSLSPSTQALTPIRSPHRHGRDDCPPTDKQGTLTTLFCSTVTKEEAHLRRLVVEELAQRGGVLHYSATGTRHVLADMADESEQSLPPNWAFLSMGKAPVSATRQVAAADTLHKRFFEWIPSTSFDANRSTDNAFGGSRGGSRWSRDPNAADHAASTSRENSVTARSGRRRSQQRAADALSRLRVSVMSSQRLSLAPSGNNSPLISTSISPSTTARQDMPNTTETNPNSPRPFSGSERKSPTNAGDNAMGSWQGPYPENTGAVTSGRSDARRLRRRREQAREEVQSVEEVAALVAARHVNDGLDLQYHRAWILSMPFKTTLTRVEAFVDSALGALKARSIVALSVDVADVTQGLLVSAAALLSLAMTRVEAANMGANGTVVPPPVAANADAASRQVPAVLRAFQHGTIDDDGLHDDDHVDLTHPRLQFLSEFFAAVEKEVRRHGVQLETCLTRVQTVLESIELPLLQQIVVAVDAAEHEPRVVQCRQRILQAVRATEMFCLIVLFDVFLSFPFASTALARNSTAPLASFTACVLSMPEVVALLECVDPWHNAPHASPDPTHLRYSNWLRRWDDDHYICYGAF